MEPSPGHKTGIFEGTILVTGASGSLGKQLLYYLHRMEIKAIAHVRESSDIKFIDSLGIPKRFADMRDRDQLRRLVEGVDGVIHSAAWVNFRQDRLTQFTGINTVGAVDLYNAAADAGVKRFVHVSTIAAVGAAPRSGTPSLVHPGRLVDETEPFNLGHLKIPYIMTKRAAEEQLLSASRLHGTELVMVNPPIIVAPSRTGDDRSKALKSFSRWFLPDLYNWVNLADIRDVACGVLAAMVKGRPGERYLLTGDNITAHELVMNISTMLGKSPQLIKPPRAFLASAAKMSVLVSRLRGKSKVSFYPDIVNLLDYDWAYAHAKARRELGFSPRSIYSTLDDLLSNNFSGSYMRP